MTIRVKRKELRKYELELEAMALAMPEVEGHPNRLPFEGVLTLVAVPSRRAPSGAQSHRVMLTRKATEAALPSLLGMALDYAPALNAHDQRRKIGVITEAEMVALKPGSADPAAQVTVSGFLYEHDFPDVVETLRAGQRRLGMSYEITATRDCRDSFADLGGDGVYVYWRGRVAAGKGGVSGDEVCDQQLAT